MDQTERKRNVVKPKVQEGSFLYGWTWKCLGGGFIGYGFTREEAYKCWLERISRYRK